MTTCIVFRQLVIACVRVLVWLFIKDGRVPGEQVMEFRHSVRWLQTNITVYFRLCAIRTSVIRVPTRLFRR